MSDGIKSLGTKVYDGFKSAGTYTADKAKTAGTFTAQTAKSAVKSDWLYIALMVAGAVGIAAGVVGAGSFFAANGGSFGSIHQWLGRLNDLGAIGKGYSYGMMAVGAAGLAALATGAVGLIVKRYNEKKADDLHLTEEEQRHLDEVRDRAAEEDNFHQTRDIREKYENDVAEVVEGEAQAQVARAKREADQARRAREGKGTSTPSPARRGPPVGNVSNLTSTLIQKGRK